MQHQSTDELIEAAFADQGSATFNTPSGALLQLLSRFARDGELEAIARAYRRCVESRPDSAHFVESQIPAKILNQYLYLREQISERAIREWQRKRIDWADQIKASLRGPTQFRETIESLTREAKRHESVQETP